jgi:hypothetical protein
MRKFGVEIELNSFDQRDFKKNPLKKDELPMGMKEICSSLNEVGLSSKIENWHHTHNNKNWIIKPDSSCGIELCSPVTNDLEDITKVIELLINNKNIKVDNRCSFHVHVDVSDLLDIKDYMFGCDFQKTSYNFEISFNLAKVLSWWIKSEHLFFDSVPESRKLNQYCQCIGILDVFEHDELPNPKNIIEKLGNKYFSLNCYHLIKGNRPTIEFRIAGSDACLDKSYVENWIELVLQFVDVTSKLQLPENFCWIDLRDFLILMNFNDKLKFWFLEKMSKNICSNLINWDFNFRKFSILELEQIIVNLQLDKQLKVNCFE